ncbi:MAG: DUF456 domain-containing protein [Treponema sp.]|nr:DUF456 domain-containing protein [Treponema sp.]
MEIAFLIIAFILMVTGIAGAVVPMIPGPPLAWAGLLLAYFSPYTDYGILLLIITGIVAVIVQILDTIFPALLTKKNNGSKAATIGATIGIIIGLFTGPVGILVGPFLGAFIGEILHNPEDLGNALSVAWGSFIGFICGTGLKLLTVGVFIWILIFNLIK